MTKGRKLKLQRTFTMKISCWLGLARWWLALRFMRSRDRFRVLYYFEFHKAAQVALRGPVLIRLERSASSRIKGKEKYL